MTIPTRKISYVLGAGFSYGTGHSAERGRFLLEMPTQNNLLEKVFQYHYRSIRDLDSLARVIRRYFSPNTYRSTREAGSERHSDIKNLSVEEVVTFFEEMIRDGEDNETAIFRDTTFELFVYWPGKINRGNRDRHPRDSAGNTTGIAALFRFELFVYWAGKTNKGILRHLPGNLPRTLQGWSGHRKLDKVLKSNKLSLPYMHSQAASDEQH